MTNPTDPVADMRANEELSTANQWRLMDAPTRDELDFYLFQYLTRQVNRCFSTANTANTVFERNREGCIRFSGRGFVMIAPSILMLALYVREHGASKLLDIR